MVDFLSNGSVGSRLERISIDPPEDLRRWNATVALKTIFAIVANNSARRFDRKSI
jgi:hypothetical protein